MGKSNAIQNFHKRFFSADNSLFIGIGQSMGIPCTIQSQNVTLY